MYTASIILAAVVYGVLLTAMAVDDWKTSSVAGWLCLVTWVLLFGGFFLCRSGWTVFILVSLLVVAFYLPLDIPFFGDADIMPFAMWLVVFCGKGVPFMLAIAYMVTLLAALIPYALVWGRLHGMGWRLQRGQMMPMLPVFALAWWVSVAFMVVDRFVYQLFYF